jgi:hypothetical protein
MDELIRLGKKHKKELEDLKAQLKESHLERQRLVNLMPRQRTQEEEKFREVRRRRNINYLRARCTRYKFDDVTKAEDAEVTEVEENVEVPSEGVKKTPIHKANFSRLVMPGELAWYNQRSSEDKQEAAEVTKNQQWTESLMDVEEAGIEDPVNEDIMFGSVLGDPPQNEVEVIAEMQKGSHEGVTNTAEEEVEGARTGTGGVSTQHQASFASTELGLLSSQRLGQNVSHMSFRFDVLEINFTGLNSLPNKVCLYPDMLG